MLRRYRRVLPFLLAGLLLFTLAQAIADSTQGHWIRVAAMAFALAFVLCYRARTDRTDDPPR